MPNQTYMRKPGSGKMIYTGSDLRHPPDLIPHGKCPFLLNVTPDVQQGRLQARNIVNNVKLINPNSPMHTVKRLNDPIPGTLSAYTYLLGLGPDLWSFIINGNPAKIDTGYSGNPLAIVNYRPPNSPDPWAYIFDSIRQRKVRSDGTVQQIGIAASNFEPITFLGQVIYNPFVEAVDPGGWAVSGDAGATATVNRSNTNVTAILYDNGVTGMAGVAVGSMSGISLGCRLYVDGNEYATVEQVFTPFNPTAITAISYDNQALNTGMCTIQPAHVLTGLVRDQLIDIGGQSTTVESVTLGANGQLSFRCNLLTTQAPGAAITAYNGFRAYFSLTHNIGASIFGSVAQSLFTYATGVGKIYKSGLNLDLTVGSNGVPISTSDYMHLSLLVDQPQNITEIHVLLDVDRTTNDFTQNYYYYVIRQGDLQNLVSGIVPSIQTALQTVTNELSAQLASSLQTPASPTPAYPQPAPPQFGSPTADQLPTSNGTWFEATFKIGDLTQVGNDDSVNLSGVKAIGVEVIFTNQASATTNLSIGSWWVGGGYGPDANYNSYGNQGTPILYRFRYRSSATGAISMVSPATRNGLLPRRQQVNVTVQGTADTQVDIIDVERFGGTLVGWHRIGYIANPGGNATAVFVDQISEGEASAGFPSEEQVYQPWPVTDKVRQGTVKVTGTRIDWINGDQFNPAWPIGTEIILNNRTYQLHAPALSNTQIDSEDNIGFGVFAFIVPEATIPGTPLPYAWLNQDGRIMACGDLYNPGRLYFTNPDNADTASSAGYIDVTDPSDALQGGANYEGADFTGSTASLFRVESTPGGLNPYTPYRLGLVPSGFAAPWAISASKGSPYLGFLGQDGIYLYNPAGQSMNVTWEELYPLFPHESAQAVTIGVANQTVFPADFTKPANLRLSYADSQYYFDFIGTDGNFYTWVYSVFSKGWILYNYNNLGAGVGGGKWGVNNHYQEEGVSNPQTLCGGVDGALYNVLGGGLYDATALGGIVKINCAAVTPSDDQGDSRLMKEYGDCMIDFSGTVLETVFFNNYDIPGPAPQTFTNAGRDQSIIALALDGFGTAAAGGSLFRNIGVVFTWTADQVAVLYEWQPSYTAKPEITGARSTIWSDAGFAGRKYVRGVILHANTFGQIRAANVQIDGQIINPALGQTINGILHNGEETLPYALNPFTAHLLRLVPQDANLWELWDEEVQWIFDQYPELAAIDTPIQNCGTDNLKFVQGIRLTADTGGLPVDIDVLGDGGVLQTTIQAATHNGQETVPYSWTPFFAHNLQLVPHGPCAIWNAGQLDWVFEPVPDKAAVWTTPAMSFGIEGFIVMDDSLVFASAGGLGDLYITTQLENSVTVTTGPFLVGAASQSEFKQRISLPPLKSRLFQFTVLSLPEFNIQVYKQDIEVRVRAWNDPGGNFTAMRPFGDASLVSGARL